MHSTLELKRPYTEVEGKLLRETDNCLLVKITEDEAVWYQKNLIASAVQHLVNGKVVFYASRNAAIRRERI